MNIVFIGGGNMASALIGGLLAQGQDVDHIGVVEINAEARARGQEAESQAAAAENQVRALQERIERTEVEIRQGEVQRQERQGEATHAAVDRLAQILNHPLCNYHPDSRSTDAAVIRNVLAAASRACELPKLDAVLAEAGISHTLGRATIAWLLKYGLLVRVPAVTVGGGTGRR